MTQEQMLARQFYRQLESLMAQPERDHRHLSAIYQLFDQLIQEASSQQGLVFHTLFSRIAFAAQQYNLPAALRFAIQLFRKQAMQILQIKDGPPESYGEWIDQGLLVTAHLIQRFYQEAIPPAISDRLEGIAWPQYPGEAFSERLPAARLLLLEDMPAHSAFLAEDPERPGVSIRVAYGLPDRNAHFDESIELIRRVFGFPTTVQLLDIAVREGLIYEPRMIVIQPDHLVDVTAIAECFTATYADPRPQLLRKYLPQETKASLVMGNLVNWILDRLISEPGLSWQQIRADMFATMPLALSVLEERELVGMLQKLQRHYVHLQQVIGRQFPALHIQREFCLLEPSFLSAEYGIQGRLDVFHYSPEKPDEAAIIELKSSTPFLPNRYGLSRNHFVQTLLYDLLIRSAFRGAVRPYNYILYSILEVDQLKYAAVLRSEQEEAINMRNRILALEYEIARLRPDTPPAENPLFALQMSALPFVKGFQARDIELFAARLQSLDSVEKAYFTAFSGFIAREQILSKTGAQGFESVNGQAALWLESPLEKEQQFRILRFLQLTAHQCDSSDPVLTLKRTAQSNALANFRVGDVALLYRSKDEDRPLQGQIHRCSIIGMEGDELLLRLRAPQLHREVFESPGTWHLEHDSMDSSFMALSRGLYAFMEAPESKRDLILSRRAPGRALEWPEVETKGLTAEQAGVLQEMLAAPEYFLLWGPPGTGKTSVMLRAAVAHLLEHSEERILLIAYTNRAVDEICEAIEEIGGDIRSQYFRIGSRYGTDPQYRGQLLDHKIAACSKRKDLVALIRSHRIVVATLASLSGKPELFKLLHFDRAIVDEASQILEPLLAGLLSQVDRFVLIGDHRQLPAVVAQSLKESRVEHSGLQELGLTDMRNSLFERLYQRCRRESWTWAYALLSHQGRMHEELMDFPSLHFYEGSLRILPAKGDPVEFQRAPLPYLSNGRGQDLKHLLRRQRLIFMGIQQDFSPDKTNAGEARRILELIQAFIELYRERDLSWTRHSLGVITPFRAQIAAIRQQLQEAGLGDLPITVDTVERYQGGARDIILISLCANSPAHLRSLISPSSDGVDRKLNVALTRARQQLILVGNPEILGRNPVYQEWIERYEV